MVFAEATTVWPQIAGYAYQKGEWKNRDRKRFSQFLDEGNSSPLPEEFNERMSQKQPALVV